MLVHDAVGLLRGYRLKLIVIAGPPLILSRVLTAPAFPCEPPHARHVASSRPVPPPSAPTRRPRRYGCCLASVVMKSPAGAAGTAGPGGNILTAARGLSLPLWAFFGVLCWREAVAMATSDWGLCQECPWWQIDPEANRANTTMGLGIDAAPQPFRLRVSGNRGCNHYAPGPPAPAAGSSAAPPTAQPQR